MKRLFILLLALVAFAALAQAPLTDAQIAAEVQALTPTPTVTPPVVPTETIPPPATVGVKGAFEVRLGGGKMFWTQADTNGFNLRTSDVMGQIDLLYWLSDHAALGVSAYHDTIVLEPMVTQLPKSSHSLWGFDVLCVYTLKTFSPGAIPEVPSAWITYLNDHAKRVSVNTIGGIGLVNIAGAPLTSTYFIGLETRYWFDTNWYASVVADVRYAQYAGANKMFPETKLMFGARF